MTVKPEKRTLKAIQSLASLPPMTKAEKVKALMKKTKISRAAAYRLLTGENNGKL